MPQKNRIKKFKPKKRYKLNTTTVINSKTVIIVFSLMAFLFFSIHIIKNISKIKLSGKTLFSNTIKSSKVSIPDIEISNIIREISSNYRNSIFNKEIQDQIYHEIKDKFPYLDPVNINFNKITGNLNITANINKSIGIIKTGKESFFLLENGKISPISYNKQEELMEIFANKKDFDEKEVSLIKKFYTNKKQLPFDFKIIINDNKILLINENLRINWGSFKHFDYKLKRLKDVLNDATQKLSPPLEIDLRFFEDGKIIVSHSQLNLIK